MFKDRIAKLIDVKSIMTLSITGAFIFLTTTNRITPDLFMSVFSLIVGFYFGSQHEKLNSTK